MMHNPAFRRALRSLAHPVTLGAVALLLANDHLLRRLWPSWWTGKLGDTAWLAFAPLLLAPLIAWLVPARLERQQALVAGLAFGLVGVGFALAKAVPAVHRAATATLAALTGAPSGLLLDPTDLLALPALGVGWWVWRRCAERPPQRAVSRQPLAWPVLALGALATLANSPAPDYGLDCVLAQPDGTLLAAASYGWRGEVYASLDGGLSWRALPPDESPPGQCESHYHETWQLSDPADPALVYRFTPGVSIERSLDGGQTWQVEQALRGVEARMAYYLASRSAVIDAVPGPLDAAIHAPTGNVVAAMGHEGVLVRTPDGRWQAIAVGEYYPEAITRVDQVWTLLGGELLLALVLVLLAFGTLALLRPRPAWWLLALVGPGWVGWVAAAVFAPAPNASTYASAVIVLASLGAGLFALAAAAVAAVQVGRATWRGFLIMAALSLDPALVYLLPFVLWALGSIPRYTTALIFALALVAAALAAGGLVARRTLRDAWPADAAGDAATPAPLNR